MLQVYFLLKGIGYSVFRTYFIILSFYVRIKTNYENFLDLSMFLALDLRTVLV